MMDSLAMIMTELFTVANNTHSTNQRYTAQSCLRHLFFLVFTLTQHFVLGYFQFVPDGTRGFARIISGVRMNQKDYDVGTSAAVCSATHPVLPSANSMLNQPLRFSRRVNSTPG